MFDVINGWIWNVVIYILIGVGLLFTLSTRGIQFRYFFKAIKFLKSHEGKGISSWQALTLSVGGRVGGGNIVGVAVAIGLGGPGAIFWMWVIGLVGMATSIWECSLAQLYKQKEGDFFRGGPAYYIVHGLSKSWHWLAPVYSVLLLLTFAVGFSSLQSYSISQSVRSAFSFPLTATGLALAAVVGVVIFGGIKRLVSVSSMVVPFMAIAYVLATLAVLAMNITEIPHMLYQIVSHAFGLEQSLAGGFGVAIMHGTRRGLLSNEAGLGSAPNVAATADTSHPVSQGLIQGLSVFIDTIVLCTCTAVMILLSGVYQVGEEFTQGITLTQNAMHYHLGGISSGFVAVMLTLFGFTTIIFNYYLGENALSFFFPGKKWVIFTLRIATIAVLFISAHQDLGPIMGFSDLTMGLLAMVNLGTLLLLFKTGYSIIQDFDKSYCGGEEEPVYRHSQHPELDLNKDAWP